LADEEYFSLAAKEFATGSIDEGIFAKARVLVEGDEAKAEFKYIELRVKQLKLQRASNARTKYVNATKDAGRIIAPAVGGFAWHTVKTVFFAILIIGTLILISQFFGEM